MTTPGGRFPYKVHLARAAVPVALMLGILTGCSQSDHAGSPANSRVESVTPTSIHASVLPTGPSTSTTTTAVTTTTTTVSAQPSPTQDPDLPPCAVPTTIRDQVSELVMVSVPPGDPAAAVSTLRSNPFLGGVFIGGNDDRTLRDPEFQSEARIGRWFVAVDEEGGRVQRIDHIAGNMPAASVQATFSLKRIQEVAYERGIALKRLGVNVDFAPVVDLSEPAPGLIIGDRSYSPDPQVVVRDAGAFAEGLRESGIMPTLKHFPGHGRASGDSHLDRVVTPDISDLASADLIPYKELAAPRLTAVMVGHLDVPGLTEAGIPASLSPAAYQLLRRDVGFRGVVFTDELSNMRAISSRFDSVTAVVNAIEAGADVALVGRANPDPYILALARAVKRGVISTERVADSVQRIAAAKSELGLGACR